MKEYCPKCYKEQKFVANPYYIHICTECGKQYDNRDLVTKAELIAKSK